MFDLGTQELIVIFIVAFLVFGPKKLPELGRTLGKGIRDLKAAMRNVQNTFEDAGSDIKEEINETKKDIEDSIYKSIDLNVKKQEEEKKKKTPESNEPDLFTQLEGAEKETAEKETEETDKDG